LPIRPIQDIKAEIERTWGGRTEQPKPGERSVAIVKWVDGTVLDTPPPKKLRRPAESKTEQTPHPHICLQAKQMRRQIFKFDGLKSRFVR
jgi:hypothetical protein